MDRVERVIEYLRKVFPNGVQAFDCESLFGDERVKIFEYKGIKILYCSYYEYIEVLGATDKEFKQILSVTEG